MALGIYIGVPVISVCMAYAAAFFRSRYVSDGKTPLKEIPKKEKKFMIVAGILFLAVAAAGIWLWKAGKYEDVLMPQFLLLWQCIAAAAYIDFKVKKIPNRLLLIGFAGRLAGILLEWLVGGGNVYNTLLFSGVGMLAGGGIILICMFVAKGGIGAGDVKLYALIGAYLGLAGLINVMFYSLFSAALVGIVLLVSKLAKRKSTLPMAPFVFLGLNMYLAFYQM